MTAETDELAIFPLSTVVLFPGVQVPLHLFEPRYRQMGDHVLAGDRRLAMFAVPPEHAAGMAGDPVVYPVGCEGRITQSQRLPDGRINLVLLGTRRVRIVTEPPRPEDRLYRVARVEPLPDPYPDDARERVADLRERIIELVGGLVERTGAGGARRVSTELFRGVADPIFVNSLANALTFAPQEKQGLLEAPDVPTRFERLEGLLSFRLAEVAGARGRSTTVH